MSKEKIYQQQYQELIETITGSYRGASCRIFCEDFSVEYNSILQEHSPFVGGKAENGYEKLKSQYGIVGLREKIKEFNEPELAKYLSQHKISLSMDEAVENLYQDFVTRFFAARGKAEDQYALIFTQNPNLPAELSRSCEFKGAKLPFDYRVIHYEDATKTYSNKNAFYTIRERRIPLPANRKNGTPAQSERPDFVHYINGIPLFIVEIKTEDSGVINSLKDFEHKETYDLAPFKIALNDGRDVLLFADLKVLKFNTGKDNSFKWVHYLKDKKTLNNRVYSNMDYLLDELFCQPENMYAYCLYGCSVIAGEETKERYLVNARIQQYFALKSVLRSLKSISNHQKSVPYNFIFEHAQRSGKTITMKLITYAIENQFKGIFNTVFFYTPDLQIKKVIRDELTQSGNARVVVKTIETREAFEKVITDIIKAEANGTYSPSAFLVYIVNMQKFETKTGASNTTFGHMNGKKVMSDRILNIIDEAHHGQTQATALQRAEIFPNASNYLFTATPKEGTFTYYFGQNPSSRLDNCDRFTISHAKACNITVPVYYFSADKTTSYSSLLAEFSTKIETAIKLKNEAQQIAFGQDLSDAELVELGNKQKDKTARIITKTLKTELYPEKLSYICEFIDRVKTGLSFAPKAIVYVESIESAKGYISYIQSLPEGKNNFFKGYRFGTDFSSMGDQCSLYNPGIQHDEDVSANFERNRITGVDNDKIIDILFAVDKYQKGFDLPTLLVTFLDANINEPSVINQIYTRSATKYPGKECGYCVDLTFGSDTGNSQTYRESIAIYDSEDVNQNFLNQEHIETKKKIVEDAIRIVRQELNFSTDQLMTPEGILEVVLNEEDFSKREQFQSTFFRQSRNIFKALREIGTPLGFNPMPVDLTAILKSFETFKNIYADKGHPEHSKILINTDASSENIQRVSVSEIKSIIEEAMQLMKLSHIKELIKISFAEFTEVKTDDLAQLAFQKQLKSETKKQSIEKTYEDYSELLEQVDTPLFERIQGVLNRISGNRTMISEDDTQLELENLSDQLDSVKEDIRQKVKAKHSGSYANFWVKTLLMGKLAQRSFTKDELIVLEPFVTHIASDMGLAIENTAQQVPPYSDPSQRAQETLTRLFNTQNFTARDTSAYLTGYLQTLDTDEYKGMILGVAKGGRFIKDFPYYSATPAEFQNFLKDVIHKTIVVS